MFELIQKVPLSPHDNQALMVRSELVCQVEIRIEILCTHKCTEMAVALLGFYEKDKMSLVRENLRTEDRVQACCVGCLKELHGSGQGVNVCQGQGFIAIGLGSLAPALYGNRGLQQTIESSDCQ